MCVFFAKPTGVFFTYTPLIISLITNILKNEEIRNTKNKSMKRIVKLSLINFILNKIIYPGKM